MFLTNEITIINEIVNLFSYMIPILFYCLWVMITFIVSNKGLKTIFLNNTGTTHKFPILIGVSMLVVIDIVFFILLLRLFIH